MLPASGGESGVLGPDAEQRRTMLMAARLTRRTCPDCGSTEVVPIAYGIATDESLEEERQGKIVLGGCLMSPDNPAWCCKACGHRWGEGGLPRIGDD